MFGCKKYDDIVFNFYQDSGDGKYNAIEIDLGNNNSAIYFINERYGIWLNEGDKQIFNFDYVPETQGGGALMIYVATQQSYYESMVQRNDGLASFYNGKMVFSGSCEFSDNGTVATISSDNIYVNEMSIASDHTVVMTKARISEEDMVPVDVALNNMSFVPNAYFEFLSNQNSSKFSCETANFWIDGATMTGEWSTNGSIVPIRMEMHDKVPYIEIFDTSDSGDKLILKAFANVLNDLSIELVEPVGDIFYTTPLNPVIVTKIN